ncbi:MAG: LysR family transcriptional regulator [Oscillospiraceae bacterium]|nr:LysR family transcriptional regulator [Oscillospiraceae bacterium]
MAEINIRQIEIFLTVAKHQNISKAAAELYISQPSISKWISNMENEIGIKLFRRTNRGVVLTNAGEELYDRLEFEYQRFRVNVEVICATRPPEGAQSLRIGSLNRQVICDIAQEQCHAYSLMHPSVLLSYERFNHHDLRSKLLCDELDLIFTVNSDVENRSEFDYLTLCDYPAFFIVPHSWANKGVDTLSGKCLLVEAPTQREWAESICLRYGISPAAVKYVSSFSALSTKVYNEEGFAIDGKLSESDSRLHDVAYLPGTWAYGGKVVMAWRKERTDELLSHFRGFLRGRSDN